MGFIIGLLTFVLVLDCLVLILLVLLQLPKKEAGAGVAFGGAATDALFGAGSGTVLTKITKYAATFFFVMSVFLSILQSRHYHGSSAFQKGLMSGTPPPITTGQPAAPATRPATTSTNFQLNVPAEATNLPATPPKPSVPATSSAPATTTAPATNTGAPK